MRKVLVFVFMTLSILLLSQEKLLDLSFFQTDIREALSQLSYEIGKPILMDSTVRGYVTLEISGVDIKKALDLILLPYGYQWTELDGVYFVGTADPGSENFMYFARTYLYRTSGYDSSKLIALLPDFMKKYVSTSEVDPTLVVINAPPKIASKVAETLSRIDVPKREVVVEVKIVEVDEATLKKWGIGWKYEEVEGEKGLTLNLIDAILDIIYQAPTSKILADIEASIADGSAKLLADPKIRILSGQSGTVSAKTKRSYVQIQDNKKVTKTVELGVEVTVTPTVLRNGEVVLSVKTSVSNALETNREVPDVVTHSLDGAVRVKIGDTITAGGVGFDTYTQSTEKVPFLGDIPVLGYLFRKEIYSKTHKEVLVFVKCVEVGDVR